MKVIKNINNNVSLCVDSKGREVIAFGKGLGFIKPPYEVPLSKIERTFYNITDLDYEGIKNIPISILNASIRIIDEVERHLNVTLMSTAALALADHINFAIQRLQEHMLLDMPIQEDIKQLYAEEMKEAYNALAIISEETGITLDRKEAGTIALHFINSRISANGSSQLNSRYIIEESIAIVEQEFQIKINKESFNYSRFATHVDYLLRRTSKNNQIESSNRTMFETLKKQYPCTYLCAVKIKDLFRKEWKITLSEEEQLYLMLHINRLCAREKGTI